MSKARNLSLLSAAEAGATADQTKADLNAIGVSGGRKNIIINGGFDVWQRGTSFTSSSVNEYSADRFRTEGYGLSTVISRQAFTDSQTDVPQFPKYYVRVATSATVAAGQSWAFQQRIEAPQNARAGQQVILSFWVKATTGTISAGAFNYGFGNGTVASPALSTTWQKVTHTITSSLSGGGAFQTIYLVSLSAGATAISVDISNVQVELGSTATDFEHRSFGEELALCQRYFYRYQGATQEQIYNENNGATAKWWFLTFPQMRATPSATFSSGWVGGSIVVIGGTINSMSVGGASPTAISFRVTNSGAGGDAKKLYHTDSFSGDYCYLSAEL